MRNYDKIRVATTHAITRIVLYNPERRNAIGPLMVNELLWALADAAEDNSVRVLMITGEGKAFCAGGDFSQMTSSDAAPRSMEAPSVRSEDMPMPLAHKGDYADLMLAMMRYEKPIVARVNGAAMGGGLGIVAASHFAIAQDDARLGTPEVDVGLFPFMIAAVLARLVPRRALLEMMLRGQKLDAEEAQRIGIVGRVVSPANLDVEIDVLCNDLAARSPMALRLGLRAFAAQDDLDLERALPMLREKLGEALGTEDAREGLTAFLQKRKPEWTGK